MKPDQLRLNKACEPYAARRPRLDAPLGLVRQRGPEVLDGRGPPAHSDTPRTLPINARLLEILWDYPRVVMPVWRRPWIGEQMIIADG